MIKKRCSFCGSYLVKVNDNEYCPNCGDPDEFMESDEDRPNYAG